MSEPQGQTASAVSRSSIAVNRSFFLAFIVLAVMSFALIIICIQKNYNMLASVGIGLFFLAAGMAIGVGGAAILQKVQRRPE